MREIYVKIKEFLVERLSLSGDTDYENNTIEAVKRGVAFKGVNLWTLIFATFIASIGLNVNSTAVIIGAMLISPLMGPILGAGLGAAQYDFKLIKSSLNNLLIATIFSICTSWLYFRLTPLAEAQSELLARTSPTIWDVLIALFGGLTGMVAVASREKGNPIAGVAIATALMPPLCTAGFGLAVGNIEYFIGALYLYIINSVMIAFGTFAVAKLLKYPIIEVHTDQQKMTKRVIALITVVIIAPSIYLAYNLVRKTVYQDNVNRFVAAEFDIPGSQVLRKEVVDEPDGEKTLKVFIIGAPVDSLNLKRIEGNMAHYRLPGTSLDIINISGDSGDKNSIDAGMFMSLYRTNEQTAREKDSVISSLEKELAGYRASQLPVSNIAAEASVLFPAVDSIALARAEMTSIKSDSSAQSTIAVISASERMDQAQREKLLKWLQKRLGSSRVGIFYVQE